MLKALRDKTSWVVGVFVCGVLAVLLLSPRVSVEKKLFNSGKQHEEQRQWQEAVEDFERIIHYAADSSYGIQGARMGGEICLYQLKDYNRAVFFFRHIVRHSQKVSEVRWAQLNLAEVYYEKLSNYQQAITEYNRLLQANPSPDEAADYHLKIARSYFYMANFEQSYLEAAEFILKSPGDKKVFDMMMLQGNALLAQKKPDDAIEIYNQMEKKFAAHPELYQVKLNKSVAYEDKQDWDKAIEGLREIREQYPHPDIIDLKIKSILRRKLRKNEA